MAIVYNPHKKKGFFKIPAGGTKSPTPAPSFSNTYSFNFDGVDDYINTGVSDLDGAGALTFSVWVNSSYTNWMYLLGDNSFRMATKPSITKIDLTFNGSVDFRSTNFTLNSGQWHHIVVTFDGSLIQANRIKLYLDNVQIANTLSGTPDTTYVANNNFMIGRTGTFSSNEWNGYIDEAATWDSVQNVTTLYNSGKPGNLASLSPVNWWRMGDSATWDGSNWTLTDQGSGSNNGTSANMVEADRETQTP